MASTLMSDLRSLSPGQRYRVVREFSDYDGCRHPVGESWEFVGTNFLPYEDGLTLRVLYHSLPCTYRLQWRPEAQAAVIRHFTDYVAPC